MCCDGWRFGKKESISFIARRKQCVLRTRRAVHSLIACLRNAIFFFGSAISFRLNIESHINSCIPRITTTITIVNSKWKQKTDWLSAYNDIRIHNTFIMEIIIIIIPTHVNGTEHSILFFFHAFPCNDLPLILCIIHNAWLGIRRRISFISVYEKYQFWLKIVFCFIFHSVSANSLTASGVLLVARQESTFDFWNEWDHM